MTPPFVGFPKISRWLGTKVAITEKIDGTNASVFIERTGPLHYVGDPSVIARMPASDKDDFVLRAGSRTRWLWPGKTSDNFGFAKWVAENAAELFKLGEGQHFGEWWGRGIQRGYGMELKYFSLFNVGRWADTPDGVVDKAGLMPPGATTRPRIDALGLTVVPTLYYGPLQNAGQDMVESTMARLKYAGSQAAPGFKNPEGVMIYFEALKTYAKAPFDPNHKGQG